MEKYEGDKAVASISIQTTFEGFAINSKGALAKIADKYNLSIPIGHSGWEGRPSPLLYSYRAKGTPWLVIIDKSGNIRFNGYHLKPEKSMALIEMLKQE